MSAARRAAAAVAAAALLAAPAGAGAIDLLKAIGTVVEHQGEIQKAGEALRKGFADLTPREEYYLGRAVAAQILGKYRALDDEDRTRYLNTVGQYVARAADRPETYGGWHFQLLDTDEVNAFAAPGGLIFVTRGLYATCATEDQLAAVLAHEVAHVTLRHGLGAIRNERLTEAFTIIGTAAAKEYSSAEVAQLTASFEGSINDIVTKMVVSGYSQGQEFEADAAAARIAWRAGYDPAGLTGFLAALAEKGRQKGLKGFFSTHPDPADRLAKAAGVIKEEKLSGETDPVRTRRFAGRALR